MGDELAGNLWVGISGQTKVGDVVGVRYRPPDQEEVAKAFCKKLE